MRRRRGTRWAGSEGPVVVVGGGIAGLATAALLAHRGREVTVLEQRPAVGGRAGTWESAGYRFDTGPSWYLMPEVFDRFFRLLGSSADEQLDLVRLDPAYRVFTETAPGRVSEPVDVRSGRAAATELFESLEPGAGRKLARYLDSARRVYGLALRRFLYTDFRRPTELVRPDVLRALPALLPGLVTPLGRYVDARFTDTRIRRILAYPAVFLGSAPGLTPSMYHLMSHLDLDDGVYYPRGGFGRLIAAVRALAERGGARIVTGARAEAIETEPCPGAGRPRWGGPRARVTGVRFRHEDGRTEVLPAGAVVGAADLCGLESTLLPPALRTYPAAYWRRRTPGPGALVVLLGVRGELPELAHHTLLFTDRWDEGFEAIFGERPYVPDPVSLYVCRTTATEESGSGAAPAGHQNLFVLVPVAADTGLLNHGGTGGTGEPAVEELTDRVVEQIGRWAGIDDLAGRVVLRRTVAPGDFEADLGAWRGSALGPAHTLRQSAFFRTGNRSRRVAGLVYAGGSTIPGIGLPMCLISAELAARALGVDGPAGVSGTDLCPPENSV